MATKSLRLHHEISETDVSVGRPIVIGALAGVGGSIVMAGYAMIASASYQHHGFFPRPITLRRCSSRRTTS
jgi:hypothetical protein